MTTNARLGPRVLRGVELHFLAQFGVLAVNLLVTPLIVHGLGTAGYALYTFLWTLSGYLIVLNMGTNYAIQRYAAYYQGRGDPSRLSAMLRAILAFQVVVSLLGALALWSARRWIILRLFHAEDPVLDAAPYLFLCVAVATPFYFVLQFGLNTLYGLQRFAAYNALMAIQSVSVAVCAAGLLVSGGGLREIAQVFVASNAILGAAALWLIRSPLFFESRGLESAERFEIAAFSGKTFVSVLVWTVVFQGDRLFIGYLLPLSQLGFYVIPASLMQKFNMFSGAVTSTTFPMIAELHGRGEEARLRRLYLKSSELSLFFLIPISIIAFVLAPQFLGLWLGPDFSLWGTWPMRLLILANLAYFSAFLPSNVAASKGHPQINTYMQLGKVVVLVVSWLLLIPRYGIAGAAAGSLLAELLCAPLFVTYIHRRFLGLGWREFLADACWRPATAGTALLALGLGVHAQAQTWPLLLASGAAGAGLYFAVGYWLLEPEAKALLSDWIKRKI